MFLSLRNNFGSQKEEGMNVCIATSSTIGSFGLGQKASHELKGTSSAACGYGIGHTEATLSGGDLGSWPGSRSKYRTPSGTAMQLENWGLVPSKASVISLGSPAFGLNRTVCIESMRHQSLLAHSVAVASDVRMGTDALGVK